MRRIHFRCDAACAPIDRQNCRGATSQILEPGFKGMFEIPKQARRSEGPRRRSCALRRREDSDSGLPTEEILNRPRSVPVLRPES